MITIFPAVNHDEHLFSILGRYQYYQSDSSPREILKDAFGKGSLRATFEFPTHLEALSKSLSHLEKSKEDYLRANTIFPFYEPFMTSEEASVLKEMMYEDGGYRVKFKIGYIAGSILKKESLYYCPECIKEDVSNDIEPYFRTVHQMQGIQVCSKHNVMLMPYPIARENMSVIRYYHLDYGLVGKIESVDNRNEHLLEIAKAFDGIRSGILEGIDIDAIKKAYRDRLSELRFMSVNGSVKYEKFVPDMIAHYGHELLASLESEIEIETEHNWIKNIHRSKNRKVHPLRHILFILYFFGSLEALKNYINQNPTLYYYPCMNFVGGHYREHVLTDKDVVTTADYKTREPVITLKCPLCGYTYSRKVSDDIYKVGRVKAFGDVWFNELQKIINEDSMSSRGKARHMGCDVGTIIKYKNSCKFKI